MSGEALNGINMVYCVRHRRMMLHSETTTMLGVYLPPPTALAMPPSLPSDRFLLQYIKLVCGFIVQNCMQVGEEIQTVNVTIHLCL